MNYRIISFITALSLFIGLPSCKKDIVDDPNNTEYSTDVEQFEAVWNGLNTSYVMWPIDSTDWDAVYEKYHPIFEDMEDCPDEMWESVWRDLTSTLIDHHLSIYLERPSTKRRIRLSPGVYEVLSRDYCHSLIGSYRRLIKLTSLQLQGRLTDVSSAENADTVLLSGVIDNEIAYFYISTFASFLANKEPFTHFKQLVANENIKAAIIDVRDNTGGIAINTDYLASCFKSSVINIGFNQTKTGLGRYELGPKVPYWVGAGSKVDGTLIEGQDRDVPIVMLCNIFSASAAEITTHALRQLPNCYVVGERTWGATCALNSQFGLFYSGSFGDSQMDNGLGNGHGHYVYTPKFLFSGNDGTSYEGYGITPDMECLFDQTAWNNGVDNQLESSIDLIKTKFIN